MFTYSFRMSMTSNPWFVPELDEFLYFCCPECDVREKIKEKFVIHALDHHPKANECLQSFSMIKPEFDEEEEFNSFEEIGENDTTFTDDLDIDEDFHQIKFEINDDDIKKTDENNGFGQDGFSESKKSRIISNSDENKLNGNGVVIQNSESEFQIKRIRIKKIDKIHEFDQEDGILENKESELSINTTSNEKKSNENGEIQNSESGFCESCGKSFSSESYLRQHIYTVHEGHKDFNCESCGKSFGHLSTLKNHIQRIHEASKDFKCESCDKSFFWAESLTKHIHTIHEGKVCESCGKSFGLKSSLKFHIDRVHLKLKPHKCGSCDKSFSLKGELNRHIHIVHEGHKDYKCESCGTSYASKQHLKRHNFVVHEGHKDYNCESCGKGFFFAKKLKQHIHTVHEGNKDYHCDSCGKSFGLLSTLRSHIKAIHEGPKDYKCESCDESFSRALSLKKHIRTIHDEDVNSKLLYKCEFCEKRFRQSYHLAWHMENKCNQPCPICNIPFKYSRILVKHIQLKHNDAFKCEKLKCSFATYDKTMLTNHIKESHEKKQTVLCSICGKSFLKRTNGHRHLETHMAIMHNNGEKPYKCSLCIKSFAIEKHLDRHIKMLHVEGAKKYQCQLCPRKYYIQNDLKRHIKVVHEKIKDYQCTLCGRAFGLSFELTRHNRIEHSGSGRRYKCEKCSYSAEEKQNFLDHVKFVHEGISAYSCDLCGKSFGIYERLRSHKRTVHAKSKNFVCSICGKAFVTSYKLKRHHNQVHEGQKRKI